jgi:hypothetical protein
VPLVLGARDCERTPDDGGDCDGGDCGQAGQGGTAGATAGHGEPAGGRGGNGNGSGDGCLYAGERYDVGDSFPSDDGCNSCSCTAGGLVACTLRACADACGGLAGLACPDGQYCNYPPDAHCGAADQTGTCEERPSVCTDQYDPVCGCDDTTYGNACEAAGAGVSIAHAGECEGGGNAGHGGKGGGDGEACGGIAGLPCGDGEFCNYAPDAQCGAADQTGTCTETPQACTRDYRPVCGCDGMTYGNPCTAAAAEVSIVHEGECDEGGGGSGQTCGGIASLECPGSDEFCNYEESAGGQGCDGSVSDAGGVCQTRPDACTQQYDPVCGCDRRTYGNACSAHADGMSVLHDGACTEIDCEAIGGHAVDGLGPAAVCPPGEQDHGPITYSNGMIAIEGTICCVP